MGTPREPDRFCVPPLSGRRHPRAGEGGPRLGRPRLPLRRRRHGCAAGRGAAVCVRSWDV